MARTAEDVLKAMYADQAVQIALLIAENEALKAQLTPPASSRPLPFSSTQTVQTQQTGS